MNPNLGVVASLERSFAKWPVKVSESCVPLNVLGVPTVTVPSGTTLALHSAVLSMMEWKYMNGLCRVAYPSLASATAAPSVPPTVGCAQSVPTPSGSAVPPSRVGSLPMSSAYSRHDATWLVALGGSTASSWLAMVGAPFVVAVGAG
jgi:hypothetical protein